MNDSRPFDPDQPQWERYEPPLAPQGEDAGSVQPTQPLYPMPNPYAMAIMSGSGLGMHPMSRAHGGATTAMTLGLIAICCAVGSFMTCGLTLPGALAGPFAIGYGLKAQSEIRGARPGTYNNAGSATTGLVTGIIGTIIGAVGVAAWVLIWTAWMSN